MQNTYFNKEKENQNLLADDEKDLAIQQPILSWKKPYHPDGFSNISLTLLI